MGNTEYPAWQETIRRAQEAQEAEIAAQLDKEAVEKRQAEMKQAEDLKTALAFFGIEAEPSEPTHVIDTIGFQILTPVEMFRTGFTRFNLAVFFVLEERYRRHPGVGSRFNLRQIVNVNHHEQDHDCVRAQLAYTIDSVTERGEALMQWVDTHPVDENAPTPAPASTKKPPSLSEQLTDLIRQIAREEIAQGD